MSGVENTFGVDIGSKSEECCYNSTMKVLYIGGIKSGKSAQAEKYTLNLSKQKPIYLATTEFIDSEMAQKIEEHKQNRKSHFLTVEEPLSLAKSIQTQESVVLVECVSMWINNMLYHEKSYEDMLLEMQKVLALKQDIVFVLNDVSASVVSENALVREFVNISGKLSQFIASECDEVYHTIAGIASRIK